MAELNKIDEGMDRVRALIRPHTSLNRAEANFPPLSHEFNEYKSCLNYQRKQLCLMLEEDLLFWAKKLREGEQT